METFFKYHQRKYKCRFGLELLIFIVEMRNKVNEYGLKSMKNKS